jgi:hypothetical protein
VTKNATFAIGYFLGANKEKRLVLASLCIVIISIFYLFVVGSALHAKIYLLLNRVTYDTVFVNHIINTNIDIFILLSATIAWLYLSIKVRYLKIAIIVFSVFLMSAVINFQTVAVIGSILTLPFIICLMVLNRIMNHRIVNYDLHLSLYYLTILIIVLASCGIISLFLFVMTGIPQASIEKYPYDIYQELPSILTPIIMILLVFCLPLRAILRQIIDRLSLNKNDIMLTISKEKISTKQTTIYLLLCILLGFAVALIPHLVTINPNSQQVGADSLHYAQWLNLMKNQTDNPVLSLDKITPKDRPLTILILFLITESTKADPFQVVEYSPVILAPLLIIVTFFLTREITSNDQMSILASFLSAISFQTLIGLYSGFYANWLALILGYGSFVFLIKCLKSPSKFKILAFAGLINGMLFAHVYTWTVLISIAFAFVMVLHILNYFPRKHVLLLYLILSSSVLVDIIKSSLTSSSTGLETDISISYSHGFGISQFRDRLNTLAETVQTYYGGIYANIVILGLGVYWLVRCESRELASIFIFIFLSSALVPLFIGDWVLQSRVLYDIPFQIPAAISLYNIKKKNRQIVSISLLLVASYLSLHVLCNLRYVLPPE